MPGSHYTQTWDMNPHWMMDPHGESSINDLNTATPNLADKPTLANGPQDLPEDLPADLTPNASWDIYYGMYLPAILYSARKGGNFLLFLNNWGSKQSVSIVQSCQMYPP